jgi:hypothetical protein
MINDYLRERACIKSVGESEFQGECLFFSFSLLFFYHFAWLYRFSCLLLAFTVFLLLDDLFELFVGFLVLDSNFKLCVFYCQWTHKGGIEKSSDQLLGLIVMSHLLDEV